MRTKPLALPLPPAHELSRDLLSDITQHSEETGTHLRRVCSLSVRLGRVLGLSGDALEDLRYGALLHDIGKRLIPDGILHKVEPLTPAEFQTIRTHSRLGADLARRSGFGDGVVRNILYHHERYDGEGYPEGLGGEEIPLGARVIAVVDTVDTIMQARAYDPPRSYAVACSELTGHAGRQFDPRAVEEYLKILADLADKRGWAEAA